MLIEYLKGTIGYNFFIPQVKKNAKIKKYLLEQMQQFWETRVYRRT